MYLKSQSLQLVFENIYALNSNSPIDIESHYSSWVLAVSEVIAHPKQEWKD